MSAHELTDITAMGARGEGLAEIGGQRVFVPYTLPGERVRASLEGEHVRIDELVTQNPDRIAPICPHFGICGGCQLQHWQDEPYRAYKRQLVADALARVGLTPEIAGTVPAHGEGRRRATLHAIPGRAGYTERRSHTIHPIDLCPILVPALSDAPAIARAAAALVGPCDVALTASATGIDVAIRTRKKPRPTDVAPLARKFGLARLALNGEVRLFLRQPLVRMGSAEVELPVESFLQATEQAEVVLSGLADEALGGAKRVADLFCGLGPFALKLAKRAQVMAFDADARAVAACAKALNTTPGLKSLGAERRDLFHDPLLAKELDRFDGVVFDPPRAGAEAQCRELAASKVKRVVAVSCNPQSFARDARLLVDGGYRLDRVTPVDQFRYSAHVELVGLFRR